jgi:hypothetical protein
MTSVARERGGHDDPAALWGLTRSAVIHALGAELNREPVTGALEPDGTVAT